MKFPIQTLHIILTASLLWGLTSPALAQQIWSEVKLLVVLVKVAQLG